MKAILIQKRLGTALNPVQPIQLQLILMYTPRAPTGSFSDFTGVRMSTAEPESQLEDYDMVSEVSLSVQEERLELFESTCHIQQAQLKRQKVRIGKLEQANRQLSKEIVRMNQVLVKKNSALSELRKGQSELAVPTSERLQALSREILRLNKVVLSKNEVISRLKEEKKDSNAELRINELSKECLRLNHIVVKKRELIGSSNKNQEILSAEIVRLNEVIIETRKKDDVIGAEMVRLNKALLKKDDKNAIISAEVVRLNKVLVKKKAEMETLKRKMTQKQQKSTSKSSNGALSSKDTSDDQFALLEDETEPTQKSSALSAECTRMVSSIQNEMKSFMGLVSKIEGAHKHVKTSA